jgi:hypothetical protein
LLRFLKAWRYDSSSNGHGKTQSMII